MAIDLSSARKIKTNGFMTIFTSAACEWFLIFLLVVDAVFAYLLKKFALYCELQIPCPLCSRLDHVFENKESGCYWSLLCNKHKGEISSLVSCSTHGKLAYIHDMCEECLMPVAMHNNSESLKLLVGKLWLDVEQSVLGNLTVTKLGSAESRICSCCNKTQKVESNIEILVEANPNGFGASKANSKPPLPCVPSYSRLNLSYSLSKNVENVKLSREHEVEPSDSARPAEDTKPTSKVGKDSNPKPNDEKNESRKVEDSSSLLLKRNESSYGTSMDDIEGESIVDRLTRQVEHDRSCMKSLYKELEAERNAASVAVNEAMAMITKLQEEKAALQMEARQYLRMMEEQSEYDKKALERANVELQDLEFYKNNLADESEFVNISKAADANRKPVNSSVLNFDKEKLYISQCLKKLEKKLYKSYSTGNAEEMSNDLNSSKSSLSDGSPNRHYAAIDSPGEGEESDIHDCEEKCDNLSNLAAFENEITALHDRLEALQTDRDLLNYASNLLQNGQDGLQTIQDLAYQLQESRKIEFRDR